jgi:cysteine desulfurase
MSLHYFDHAASAPRRDEVFEAMAPYMHGVIGNPSGTHRAARAARRAIEDARDEVAAFCAVEPGGVIFTAGGTESCHLAVSGVTHRFRATHAHSEVVTSAIEHHAVLESVQHLDADYSDVSSFVVGVDADGVIDLDELESRLSNDTALVTIMTANNETGIIEPIDAVVDVVRRHAPHAVVHSDAVAAAPWLDLSVVASSVDLVSICAHKLGGPVNSGALAMRGSVALDAVVSGGGQERGLRGGTVDVAAAVGLAAAVRATARERESALRTTAMRAERLGQFLSQIPGVQLTAANANKLPGHVHVTVDAVASDELLFVLDQDGICASAASSCSSGAGVASHVLAAMAMSAQRARGAVRFTLGAETTDEDVSALCASFSAGVSQLRGG